MSKYGKYTRRDADQEIFKPKEDTRYWERGTHKLMIKCPKCGEVAFVRESWSTFTCFKCYNIITREQHIHSVRDYIEADISYFLYAYGNMNHLSLKSRYPDIRVSKYEWGTMTPEQRAECVLKWLTKKDYAITTKLKLGESDVDIDRGIVRLVARLNRTGYITSTSCSGLQSDHKDKPVKLEVHKPKVGYQAYLFGFPPAYISFRLTDNDKISRIKYAADKAGLYYSDKEFAGPSVSIYPYGHLMKIGQQAVAYYEKTGRVMSMTPYIKSDADIKRIWYAFEKYLFE